MTAVTAAAAGWVAPVAAAALPVSDSAGPIMFSFTGSVQTVTVPAGVQAVSFQAVGGSGADAVAGGAGGLGGVTTGSFYVTPGDQLELIVGGMGISGGPGGWGGQYSGGASGTALWIDDQRFVGAGGGGGASVILTGGGGTAMTVAGGGGGGGADGSIDDGSAVKGGAGGNGGATPTGGAPGSGTPRDSGGAGGAAGGNIGTPGAVGADAINTAQGTNGPGGGGGGGALYGGAGGGVGAATALAAGGGGGGAGQSLVADPGPVFDGTIGTAPLTGAGSIQLFWDSGFQLDLTGLPATVTASTTAVPFTVSAVDSQGNLLPDPTGHVTVASSEPTDTFTAGGVVMTTAGYRTITAAWNGVSAGSASTTVDVEPGAVAGLRMVGVPPTATDGSTVILMVEGIDAYGNLVGDATSDASYHSSVAADVFSTVDANEVTVHGVGPHTFTASYPGLTPGTSVVEVQAAVGGDDAPVTVPTTPGRPTPTTPPTTVPDLSTSVLTTPPTTTAIPAADGAGSPPAGPPAADRLSTVAAAQFRSGQGDGPGLAATGTDVAPLVVVGGAAVVGGVALVLLASRRRRT
ncbi:hypothetical protein [Nakamurella leprariae]|uniref:Gram-positive cocci surface proteins LPxTG domain-containing protein n=1 Tax=Nakamurella leprariae TaxID=2803911 RepID=A0A939BZA2_9ACTN|nr:hypothetical protein [Nakamurella leprariae]MBM9467486.1 hypothetical protein [Nakamurella leprariae]